MRFRQTHRMSHVIQNNHHQELDMRRDQREDTADLHARIDRLNLVTEALWTLLQEASNLTDEHLQVRIKELDSSDGYDDGVYKPPACRCAQCDAAIGRGRKTCMFCGAEATNRSPFRSV